MTTQARGQRTKPNPAYLVVAFMAGAGLLAVMFDQQQTEAAEAAAAEEAAQVTVDVAPASEAMRAPEVSPLADLSVDLWGLTPPDPADPLAGSPTGSSERGLVPVVEPPIERPTVSVPSTWPSEVDALLGRYRLYWEAYAAAFGRPRVDLDPEVLRSLSTEVNWADVDLQLKAFTRDGLVLDRVDDRLDRHRVRLPHDGVLSGREGDEVVIQDCWFDEFVVGSINDPGPADPSAARADRATLLNVVMQVQDGEWRVHGIRRATSASAGYAECLEHELGDQ